jgi:hypothetical protein
MLVQIISWPFCIQVLKIYVLPSESDITFYNHIKTVKILFYIAYSFLGILEVRSMINIHCTYEGVSKSFQIESITK